MQAQIEEINISHKVNMFTLNEDYNNDDHLNYKSSMLLVALSLHTKSLKKNKTDDNDQDENRNTHKL